MMINNEVINVSIVEAYKEIMLLDFSPVREFARALTGDNAVRLAIGEISAVNSTLESAISELRGWASGLQRLCRMPPIGGVEHGRS
jgi:hypothetical protein